MAGAWCAGSGVARCEQLLDASGIANAADAERGYDHGTFIPLKLTYPDADVPAIQLSLKRGSIRPSTSRSVAR